MASSVMEPLTEEECYLWAIISDESGLDLAELVLTDEQQPDRCFRAWPFQWSWYRCNDRLQVDQGSRASGKSMSIRLRALVFPFIHPQQEMVITAPEGSHAATISREVEKIFTNNRLPNEMLVRDRGGITHKPFTINFSNGATIRAVLPQRTGAGLKGCVAEGTFILTDQGYVVAEDLKVGDRVLTHENRYMPIVEMLTNTNDCYEVKAQGMHPMVVSDNHKFFGFSGANGGHEAPRFYQIDELDEFNVSIASPTSFPELPIPDDWSISDSVPAFVLGMGDGVRAALLDGWLSDGSIVTESKKFAIEIQMLAQSLGRSVTLTQVGGGWNVAVSKNNDEEIAGYRLGKVESVTHVGERRIFNPIVEEDHSYVSETVISHNLHPLWLEIDEAQDFPPMAWEEIIETLQRGTDHARWRCIAGGQLVLTFDGWKPIEEVQIGDKVMTHKQRWRTVTSVWDNGIQDCVEVKGNGPTSLVMTPNHKLWTRESKRIKDHKVLLDPAWKTLEDSLLTKGQTHWSSPTSIPWDGVIPPFKHEKGWRNLKFASDDPTWLWLYGLYIAEGYGCDFESGNRQHRRVHWCVNDNECDEVAEKLHSLGLKSHFYRQGKSVKVIVGSAPLYFWLKENAGASAINKKVASWVFGLSKRERQLIFDGAQYGDGSWSEDRGRWEYATVSHNLALDMKILGQSLGFVSNLRFSEPKESQIDGRTIHSKGIWTVQCTHKDNYVFARSQFLDDNLVWSPMVSGQTVGAKRVYDLTVEEDHSYVVEGQVVSNCHGVTRGVRDKFYEFTQPESNWTVHHYPAMYRPTWDDEEREEKIKLYGGSVEDPAFRRNVYGVHGDSSSVLFVLYALLARVDKDEESDYNVSEYANLNITAGMVKDAGDAGIESLLDLPAGHKKMYDNFWMGMDVGYTVDPSVIVIFGEAPPEKRGEPKQFKLLAKIVMKQIPNPDQAAAIMHLIDEYRPKAFAMDSTGAGLPLFQDVQFYVRKNPHLKGNLDRIKGYNFSSNIVVGIDDTIEYDEYSKDNENAEIKKNVLDHSTELLRGMVDDRSLKLPYDLDLLEEFRGQTYTFSKASNSSEQHSRRRLFCADDSTEVLTNHGWKTVDEIAADDQAWGYDTEDRTAHWTPISKVNQFHGEFNMVRMTSTSHDSLTTMDHRWPLERLRNDHKLTKYWWAFQKFSTTAELPAATTRHSIPCAATPKELPESKVYSDAFVRLVAWFITEGSCFYPKGRTKPQVAIVQSRLKNPMNCRDIERDLDEWGTKWSKYESFKGETRGMNTYRILTGPHRSELLGLVLDDKRLDPEFLGKLTEAQLWEFLDICIRGDGWVNWQKSAISTERASGGKIYDSLSIGFSQKRKHLTDLFAMACSMVGLATSQREYMANGIAGRLTDPYLMYNCHVRQYNGVTPKSMDRTEEKLSGRIWCPTTETGTWLARRNGKVYFTGNSQGYYHSLDACRMAALGFSQHLVDAELAKRKNEFTPVPTIFIN